MRLKSIVLQCPPAIPHQGGFEFAARWEGGGETSDGDTAIHGSQGNPDVEPGWYTSVGEGGFGLGG